MTSPCKPDISGMPQAAVLAGFPKRDPAGGAECPLVSLLLVSNPTCGYHRVQPPCPELSSSSVPSVPSAGQLPLPLGGSGRASAPQGRATEQGWGQLRVAAVTQLQEPGAGQRSCAPGLGHPGAPEACCKAWPLLLRAKPYLCHWCSLGNNEHKGIPHSHREQPACLQHRLHAGWRLKRGEGPDQWESCCALRPCFTLWSPDQCWCHSA